MKYFSKQVNYRVVLVSGQSAERATGKPMQPGVYVKFENGVALVKDTMEDVIRMMDSHPQYGVDFIREDHQGETNILKTDKQTEPDHTLMNIKHGSVEGSVNAKPVAKLSPDQQKAVTAMAVELAKDIAREMAPALAKEMAMKMVEEKKEAAKTETKTETKVAKKEPLTNVQAPEEASQTGSPEKAEKDQAPETVKNVN